jgi:hypothetical protein
LEICSSVVISSTAGSRSFVSPATRSPAVLAGYDSDDHTGRNGAKRDPAGRSEHREAQAAGDTSPEDESSHAGNRQSGERLVPDVLGHIPGTRLAVGWTIQGKLPDQATRLTICAAT